MSTWKDDITDPKLRAAYDRVGNQDTTSLRNMIRALTLPISAFLNTPEDEERLAAARYILKSRRTRKP